MALETHSIKSEARHSFSHIKSHYFFHGVDDSWVAVVQVWLLGGKLMQVVTAIADVMKLFDWKVSNLRPASFMPRPSWTTKNWNPIIWESWSFRCIRVSPVVPNIELFVNSGTSTGGIDKPLMLIGGVVGNEVQHQADTQFIRFCHQFVKVRHRAVVRFNRVEIAHIVSSVNLRRCKNRR